MKLHFLIALGAPGQSTLEAAQSHPRDPPLFPSSFLDEIEGQTLP